MTNYTCSLCGIIFYDDFEIRQLPHERFHKHCKSEKRNTVEGIVKWFKGGDTV
jgi:hypothetical protein|tara:strand:- start:757 stop:915 length:159 start_codon:yes stop_codon:yes gene_type:complete